MDASGVDWASIGKRVRIGGDFSDCTETLARNLRGATGVIEAYNPEYNIRILDGRAVARWLIRLDEPAKCCEAENWPPMSSIWLKFDQFHTVDNV
jgi:hypothetical protein